MSRKKIADRVSFSSPEAVKIKDTIRTLYAQTNPKLTWKQISEKAGVSKSVVERALKGIKKRQDPARVAFRIKKMVAAKKRNKLNAPKDQISVINTALARANADVDGLDSAAHTLQRLFPGVRKLILDFDKGQVFAERIELVAIGTVGR